MIVRFSIQNPFTEAGRNRRNEGDGSGEGVLRPKKVRVVSHTSAPLRMRNLSRLDNTGSMPGNGGKLHIGKNESIS